MATFSFRTPEHWVGQLDSTRVRGWLMEYFQHPQPLPPDPGAGPSRVCLSLPERAVKILEGLSGDSASGALRRLIAAHIKSLPIVSQRPGLALSEPRRGAELPAVSLPRRVDFGLTPPAQEESCRCSPARKSLIHVPRSDEMISPFRPTPLDPHRPEWSQLPKVPPWVALVAVALVVALVVGLVWLLGRASRRGGSPRSGAAGMRFKPWIPKV